MDMGILKLKSALLATAALGVATASSSPAMAADVSRSEISQAEAPWNSAPAAHAADDAQPAAARQGGWLAAGAAVLAALAGLVGWTRIRRAASHVAPIARQAVSAAAAAPVAALRAAANAAAKPFQFVAGLFALAAFSLFGVGFYDVEWAGGLAAGALSVAAIWMTVSRARRFVRVAARRKTR